MILLFEVAFTFFAKPILKKTIAQKIYSSTNGVYKLEFNNVKINILSGHFLLTDFELSPDTNAYFKNLPDEGKNLYYIELDTFEIKRIRFLKLLKKDNSFSIEELYLSNPRLKVFGLKPKDTTSKFEQKSASYETVKTDVISSAFSFVNSVDIKKITISNGNFDFLKPRADNPNPFSINSITFILNDFYADSKTFSPDRSEIFSEDITLIINEYQLKMNDDIHVLDAEKVYVSTKEKTIQLYNISMNSGNKPIDSLSKLDANIFDFKIDNLKLKNANFKEIYLNNHISIGKASVNGFRTIVYGQKEKVKEKEFSKDSLLNKINIYPMFSNFLDYINIDTLEINNGHFESFNNISSSLPKTIIESYQVTVNDFLIDSVSIADTNRILYAKDFEMIFHNFEQKLNDSIHSLTASSVVATTDNNTLWASNINVTPNPGMRLWAIQHGKSVNDVKINKLEIKGLSFTKFFNYNQIYVDSIILANSNISLSSYSKKAKKAKSDKTPLNELFLNFADKMVIKNIDVKTGFVKYNSRYQNRNSQFTGNFKLCVSDLVFDPYSTKVTKLTRVSGIDALFSNIKYNTPDSIYSLSVETLHYATYLSSIVLDNLKIKPISNNLFTKLRQHNKTATISLDVPTFKISNTNLSNAFQSDSLSLKNILLDKPVINITTYPEIRLKFAKNGKIDSIKNESINELDKKIGVLQIIAKDNFPLIDSSSIQLYNQKHDALDSINAFAQNCINEINIDHNNIYQNDTSIIVISEIINTTISNCIRIAIDSLVYSDIITAYNTSIYEISQIKEDYEAPKINFDEIYMAIGQFLPKISSELLQINDGYLSLKAKSKDGEKLVFQTNFNLILNKFDFDTAFVDHSKDILFSESFIVTLENTIVNINDRIHQIVANKIIFNSRNEYIDISDLKILPKYIDTNQLCIRGKINQIRFNNIDFNDLYFDKTLNVALLKFTEPKIKLYLSRVPKIKKDALKSTEKTLPEIIKKILVNDIVIQEGELKMYKNWKTPFLSTGFDIEIFDISADSVVDINDNLFFIPLQGIDLQLNNLQFVTKDSSNLLNFDELKFNTVTESIQLSNLSFLSIITDSIITLNYLKKKNYVNLTVPSIDIKSFDIAKFRFDKQLRINEISINHPSLVLESFKKDTVKPFVLEDINLYKSVSKFAQDVEIHKLNLNDIEFNQKLYTDTSEKYSHYSNISLFFNEINIDSSTSITEPNLFYTRDLRFAIRDFSLDLKDSLSVVSFIKVSGSTLSKNLQVAGLKLYPKIRYEELVRQGKLDTFRKAEIMLGIKNIIIPNLDYRQLLVEEKISTNSILIDTVKLQVHNPSWRVHDSTKITEHLLAPIFKLPIIVDVKKVDIQCLDLIYSEVSEEDKEPAIITLLTDTLVATNITNDTNIINNSYLNTKIVTVGKLNDSAEINIAATFNLKSRAKVTKISGNINKFNLSSFNSYLYNAFDLKIRKGILHVLEFEFYQIDSVSYGYVNLAFSDIKASYFSGDSSDRKTKIIISKLINLAFFILEDSRKGITYRWGTIAAKHDMSFGDFKLWIDALISGFVSAFIKTKDNKIAQKQANILAKEYGLSLDNLKKE